MLKLILYINLCSLISFATWGQKNYTVTYLNNNHKSFIKNPKITFKDSVSAKSYLSDLQFSAIKKGFLLASIDSIYYKEKGLEVDFFLGNKFKEVVLNISSEELSFIKKHTSLSEKFITQIPFTPRELSNSLEQIRDSYLNNGYPFIKIQLENTSFQETSLKADLAIDRGELYKWQKIHVKGDSSLSTKFISNLIGIKKGHLFNESLIKEISQRINQVPYIEEIKPSEILLTKNGAELFLYLKSNPISSINGVLGLQPSPDTEKLSVTGELNLKLLNVLKRGELLDIQWQSIREQTQSLTSRLSYPFLFNTPFGIDASFDLYKRDTSFLELKTSIGIQYLLSRGNYIKGFYQNITSSVLFGGLNNPEFTNLGNVKSNFYGLAYSSIKVDYYQNPRKGTIVYFETSVGSRSSQKTDTSQVIRSSTYRGRIKLELFIPLHKRHVLRLANSTEFYGADDIFENEVYRFGGFNSQRGFNEDELLATTKNVSTIEYRFLLDKNSRVFAFIDQSWYENVTSTYYNDSPTGFGLGFAFSTNFGTFSILYALGKQQGNPVLLSDSKIHFGYIAYF